MYSRINHTSLLITLVLLTGSNCFVSKASEHEYSEMKATAYDQAVQRTVVQIRVKDKYKGWINVTYDSNDTYVAVSVAPRWKTRMATTVVFFGGLGYCYQNASIFRLFRNSCLQTIRSRDGLLYIAAAGAVLGSWYIYQAIADKKRELQSNLKSCLECCKSDSNDNNDYRILSNSNTGTFYVHNRAKYDLQSQVKQQQLAEEISEHTITRLQNIGKEAESQSPSTFFDSSSSSSSSLSSSSSSSSS